MTTIKVSKEENLNETGRGFVVTVDDVTVWSHFSHVDGPITTESLKALIRSTLSFVPNKEATVE